MTQLTVLAREAAAGQGSIGVGILAMLVTMFVSGLIASVAGFRAAIGVHIAMKRLRDSGADDLSGNSYCVRRLRLLAERLAAVRKEEAVPPRMDQDVALIERFLMRSVNLARAIAGILIILGLLLTLVNLRVAILGMQGTFAPTSTAATPASTAAVAARSIAIQQSMQSIVGSAGTAFQFSAVAIAGAVLLLLSATVNSAVVERGVDRCRGWLADEIHALTISARTAAPTDPAAALLDSLTQLNRLTETFENTNQSLNELRGFGDSVDAAAKDIRDAVQQLPAHIGQSVHDLGGGVTQGINQNLEHQLGYLTQLVTVYTEQHVTLKALVTSVHESAQGARAAARAAEDVPVKLMEVVAAVRDVSAVTHRLSTGLDALTSKVADIPVEQMRVALQAMETGAKRLEKLESEFVAMAARLVAEARTSGTELAGQIVAEVGRIRGAFAAHAKEVRAEAEQASSAATDRDTAMRGEVATIGDTLKAYAGSQGEEIAVIRQGIANLIRLAENVRQRPASGGDLGRLIDELDQLARKIDSLPWFTLRRLVRRH